MYVYVSQLVACTTVCTCMCTQQMPCYNYVWYAGWPQGADRSFLEELLLYLRQQHRQLDESKRLLENMEQQQQQQQDVHSTSRVNVETAQSGTIPSVATGQSGRERRRGGGGRVGSTGVDLSSLYEHCKIER